MTKRHGIRVLIPDVACELYAFVNSISNELSFAHYGFWDPVLKREAPFHEAFLPYETLFQGAKVILNQSFLYHAFYEATLNPLLFASLIESSTANVVPVGTSPSHTLTIRGGAKVIIKDTCEFVPSSVYYPQYAFSSYVGDTSMRYVMSYNKIPYDDITYQLDWQSLVFDTGTLNTPCCPVSIYMVKKLHAPNGPSSTPVSLISRKLDTNVQHSRYRGIKMCNVTPEDFDVDRLSTAVNSLPSFVPIPHDVPLNLIDRIYSNLIIPNVNNIENAGQVKGIRRILPDLRKAIVKHDFKSFAELYLMWKYTFNTTAMDLKAYYAYFHDMVTRSTSDTQMVRISGTNVLNSAITTRYSISLPTFTAGLLETCGLTPSLVNVWDTLPFTFVADWFINFGSVLERIHQENILSTLSIRYCTCSAELNDTIVIQTGPFTGQVVVRSIYDRTVSNHIPTPDVDVVFQNPIRHLVDGTALLVALRR